MTVPLIGLTLVVYSLKNTYVLTQAAHTSTLHSIYRLVAAKRLRHAYPLKLKKCVSGKGNSYEEVGLYPKMVRENAKFNTLQMGGGGREANIKTVLW